MKPDKRFVSLEKAFWAHVRCISEQLGYTDRQTKEIKIPTIDELVNALKNLSLSPSHLLKENGKPSAFGDQLHSYFAYRAKILNKKVRPLLMNTEQASKLFAALQEKLQPKIAITMNKQKGEKKKPAYLTGIVNMLIDHHRGKAPCNFDPRHLTSVTRDKMPVRTLARRVDGAFPGVVNPIAIWEVKEYYHTTTFGSRVADGVYETLLDGMEIEELNKSEKIHVRHYLFLDAEYTWWQCGRSYLCRIIDMMHMGYVDEVLFGKEVVERLPSLVAEWKAALEKRK